MLPSVFSMVTVVKTPIAAAKIDDLPSMGEVERGDATAPATSRRFGASKNSDDLSVTTTRDPRCSQFGVRAGGTKPRPPYALCSALKV